MKLDPRHFAVLIFYWQSAFVDFTILALWDLIKCYFVRVIHDDSVADK